MKSLLLFAGFLVSMALISIAVLPSKPQAQGSVSFERESPEVISTVRGTPITGTFLLRNGTVAAVSIDGVQTGCGCAVLTAGAEQLPGSSISPGGFLKTTLEVDTTNRAMGDFTIPVDVFLADREGARYQVRAVQSIRVNPGWTASKSRLTLQAESAVAGIVSDDFVLFQTSTEHPFTVVETTIRRDGIVVDLQDVDPQEHSQDLVVGGTTADTQWNANPRYRVRVSIPAIAITNRATIQLALQLSHNLTRVVLDVELLPAPRPLRVTPTELFLDRDAGSSTREFVVSTQGSLDSLKIKAPAGAIVVGTTALGKQLLKVKVQVDHSVWEGEAITIEDAGGNQESLPVRPVR